MQLLLIRSDMHTLYCWRWIWHPWGAHRFSQLSLSLALVTALFAFVSKTTPAAADFDGRHGHNSLVGLWTDNKLCHECGYNSRLVFATVKFLYAHRWVFDYLFEYTFSNICSPRKRRQCVIIQLFIYTYIHTYDLKKSKSPLTLHWRLCLTTFTTYTTIYIVLPTITASTTNSIFLFQFRNNIKIHKFNSN